MSALKATFELDTCTVVFGYDMFRPENCLFISKWTGEAIVLTNDEFIEGMRQAEAWKKEHPEQIPQPPKPRGRPRAASRTGERRGREQVPQEAYRD